MTTHEYATAAAKIAESAEPIDAHEELFYQSAEFWVGAAFVLVVAALFSPLAKVIKELIKNRISRIKTELSDAENLKLDAQKLYADYERKFVNKDKEVAEIIAKEESIIAENKEKKLNELNSLLRQKQLEADTKIELAYERADAEINMLIGTKAIDILQKVISSKLTKADYNKLIEQSITGIKAININK